nr:aspartic peptidase A1 family [Tanacetum cinerariifolium]
MVISCAPKTLLQSFPKDVFGVAAFSWSALAFPKQLKDPDVADKFALCLATTSSAVGVTFLGDGPFYFTNLPKVDLRSFLSYTPMVRKDSKSLGFNIRLNRVLVEGTPVALPTLKSQSVKLSTIVPYATLRSDIYKAFVTSFSKATANIPKVNAVKPFSLCVKSSAISSVPKIDLETESGKIWTISKENSMKDVGKGVSCLAFLSGGSRAKDAIVIGTYQMENNFLYFDLVNQKLGFSSSLLARGTSCGSFNFTELLRPGGTGYCVFARLYHSSQGSKKLAWIKWTNILASYDKEGLAIEPCMEVKAVLITMGAISKIVFAMGNGLGVGLKIFLEFGTPLTLITFFVASLRRQIDDHILPSLDSKTTWDKTLSRKVNIFMWRLKLDWLPHRLNLSSRGIEIPEISCFSCSGNVESNHHIFLAVNLLRWFERLFGVGVKTLSLFSIPTPIGLIRWIRGQLLKSKNIAFSLSLQLLYGSFDGIVIVSSLTLIP